MAEVVTGLRAEFTGAEVLAAVRTQITALEEQIKDLKENWNKTLYVYGYLEEMIQIARDKILWLRSLEDRMPVNESFFLTEGEATSIGLLKPKGG